MFVVDADRLSVRRDAGEDHHIVADGLMAGVGVERGQPAFAAERIGLRRIGGVRRALALPVGIAAVGAAHRHSALRRVADGPDDFGLEQAGVAVVNALVLRGVVFAVPRHDIALLGRCGLHLRGVVVAVERAGRVAALQLEQHRAVAAFARADRTVGRAADVGVRVGVRRRAAEQIDVFAGRDGDLLRLIAARRVGDVVAADVNGVDRAVGQEILGGQPEFEVEIVAPRALAEPFAVVLVADVVHRRRDRRVAGVVKLIAQPEGLARIVGMLKGEHIPPPHMLAAQQRGADVLRREHLGVVAVNVAAAGPLCADDVIDADRRAVRAYGEYARLGRKAVVKRKSRVPVSLLRLGTVFERPRAVLLDVANHALYLLS